jgi:uncharacterized repeat protein (TIGR03803 family)
MRLVFRGVTITLAALSLTASALAAPVETVLHSFTGGSDGSIPSAGLIADKQGALYGTTEFGGNAESRGSGTVFEVTLCPEQRRTDDHDGCRAP